MFKATWPYLTQNQIQWTTNNQTYEIQFLIKETDVTNILPNINIINSNINNNIIIKHYNNNFVDNNHFAVVITLKTYEGRH